MVARGQYLERPALVPLDGGAVLEGLWHRGTRTPPLLVVPPPPAAGSMDHVVCAELAWAAARSGHAVLRFNFRGVGASPGPRGDARARLADARAALRLVDENVGAGVVAVAGVGESAATALALGAGPSPVRVAAVVLVSPPADVTFRAGAPVLVVAGEEEPGLDRLARTAEAAGVRLERVAAADARFQRNLPEVGQATLRWLAGVANTLES